MQQLTLWTDRWMAARVRAEDGRCSELQLSSSPVSPSGVVPDCVVSSISDPVGQRTVLLDLFSHTRLLSEALDRSHYLDILLNNK